MNKGTVKKYIKAFIISTPLILFCCIISIEAKTFKFASYNPENLFDLTRDGTEYQAYIPNTAHCWKKDIVKIKYTNIARVIKDLKSDIVALQEVESEKALIILRNRLKDFGVDYPYLEIANSRTTTVKCALLSKFPVFKKEEIQVADKLARNILKITIDVDGNHLILFINHWKSKQGPESLRIAYAKALRKEINKLKDDADFILAGDFNSNYNEYKTFRNSERLNDTGNITGINHILKTIKKSGMVNEEILTNQATNKYLYNLWLEVSKSKRWSYLFSGKKESPDNIILSKGLYDNNGISYIDNSFNVFKQAYLFKKNGIYRWQMTKKGRGRHLGMGYSDHLPIFTYFSTDPFCFKTKAPVIVNDSDYLKNKSLQKLLNLNTASQEELMLINGIGYVLSARIIAARPYKTVDDLIKVKGIGKKRLKRIRPFFSVIL